MALSDLRTMELRDAGDIVIHPFDRRQLGTSSYDVRLGEFYYRERRPGFWRRLLARLFGKRVVFVFDPYDEADVARVWDGPFQSQTIEVGPGETILAHTEEFVGGRRGCTAKMHARSSLGRCFVEVCKCAGWGDVGYVNRWTMEITNNSLWYTIPLRAGTRVGQMVFTEVGPIAGDDYSVTGKYSSSTDLDELRSRWCPDMMLPRLYRDYEVRPSSVRLASETSNEDPFYTPPSWPGS